MAPLGIRILRNGQEVSVKSLKSDVRDALRNDIEEQLIQKYEFIMGGNKGKDYKVTVTYVSGKQMFKLEYDESQDPGGETLKGFEFKELDDYLGIYGGKTYTAEIASTFEGGRHKKKTRKRKSRKVRH